MTIVRQQVREGVKKGDMGEQEDEEKCDALSEKEEVLIQLHRIMTKGESEAGPFRILRGGT